MIDRQFLGLVLTPFLNIGFDLAILHSSGKIDNHCVKSVRIRSYSGPELRAFGLNTER